jgi:hypothetical protein
MSQTQTSHAFHEHPRSLILKGTEVKDSFSNAAALFDHEPMELVDMALRRLQNSGIQPVEWRSRLYRRMGVPVINMVCIDQP